jgi:hypothetical protein
MRRRRRRWPWPAGRPATLTKVEAMESIVGYRVMRTPALVIGDRVVASGRVPSAAEIVTLINAAVANV